MMAPGFPAFDTAAQLEHAFAHSCNPTRSNVRLEENLVDSEGVRVSPCTAHTQHSRD